MAASELVRDFKNHKIVPDVIPVPPESLLHVTYPGEQKVNLGNILMPKQVKDCPVVQWPVEPKTFYTLCMTDPDAPSRTTPKFREWHHWSSQGRGKFSIQKFSEKYQLGIPVAGNFFQAQYDDYVPKLYRQLGQFQNAF
ncbi:hypothetical protein RP20_CCG014609 [Aedes albopictus]|nr:hypothetical protein RP20_CCG014609 [Aedes albopictus]